MTTPPLDLTALREYAKELERDGARSGTIRTDVLRALLDRLEAAEDERDKAQRACQTLGRVIDRQCEDALQATDSQDLLWGDDGDGDWGAIWERVLGLGEKAREATARAEAAERDLAAVTVSRDGWQTRAEAAEKKVAKVREIAHRLHSEYHQADEVTESIDHADDIAHELDTALDNHTPETETTP